MVEDIVLSGGSIVRKLTLWQVKELLEKVRREPPPPPSADFREAFERDLHGGCKPRRLEEALKLAWLARENMALIVEVIVWEKRGRRVLRLKT